MKWIKKWSYLLILFFSGILFFLMTDSLQVAAKPGRELLAWAGKQADIIQGKVTGRTESALAEDGLAQRGDSGKGLGTEAGQENGAEENQGLQEAALDGTQSNTEGNEEVIEAAGGQSIEEKGDTGASTQNHGENGGKAPQNNDTGEEEQGSKYMYTSVEDDYFQDAVFIGDSRTVGLFEYGGLEDITTFYASTGLTVYKMFSEPIVTVPGQKNKITVEEALSQRQFAKIYLMIGINEMGTGTVDTFIQKYTEVVEHLKELQPDAIIYLQAIMKVTTERSNKGDYINNEGIEERNERIAQLADNDRVFYLDVNPLICDETGGMEASYTFDGVHLKAQYVLIWKEFLKENALVLRDEVLPFVEQTNESQMGTE